MILFGSSPPCTILYRVDSIQVISTLASSQGTSTSSPGARNATCLAEMDSSCLVCAPLPLFSTSPSYNKKIKKGLGFLQIRRSWRTCRLDTRMLVTRCHRWVRSCRFEQLKASKTLLKSITKNTVRKDDISLTKTCFWFTKRNCFSPWSTNILFWKKYIWNVSFADALCFIHQFT